VRIALTPGEPAGIGPDLVIQIAQRDWPAELVAVADPSLLADRARLLELPLDITEVRLNEAAVAHRAGQLKVLPVPLAQPVSPGVLNPANSQYVLTTLAQACRACLDKHCGAMVTAPVHKGAINDAGHAFSGHTEFLAELCLSPLPVMMLCTSTLRVALVTTHLPLTQVSAQITAERLANTLRILDTDLRARFGIPAPRILVCGLNPHAGEGGYLGREELEVLIPVIESLKKQGLILSGPVPADTAFTPAQLQTADAVLAMYHDQGLAPFKALSFGESVNVTLGLPILRTSVDHGTALDLAGTGRADTNSLMAALELAIELAV
jgi:4-hydroxythreonine-4-phosphate dehydrogenase